jgi:hypothetical protein
MFAKEAPCLDGEKTNIEAIVNIEVEIIGYRIKPSKYPGKNKSGQCLFLQMRIPGEDKTRIVFTGSDVLISQMKEYGHEVPFWATIRKVNRYYTLS